MTRTLTAYAGTTVSPSKSRENIEKLLVRIDAKGFRWASTVGYPGQEVLEAIINWNERDLAFRLEVRFDHEKHRAQLMRALYWYLKTKVEAVQLGLVDLEREFLPYLLTKSGRTIYEELGGPEMALLPPAREE